MQQLDNISQSKFYVLRAKLKYLSLIIKPLKEQTFLNSTIKQFCYSVKKPDCFFIKYTGNIHSLLRIINPKYFSTYGRHYYTTVSEIKNYYLATTKKQAIVEFAVGERVLVVTDPAVVNSKTTLYGHIIEIIDETATIAIESSSRFPITYKVNINKQLKKLSNDSN